MSLLLDALNKAQRQNEPSSEVADAASSTLDLGDIPDLDVSAYSAPRAAQTREPLPGKTNCSTAIQGNPLHSAAMKSDLTPFQNKDLLGTDDSETVHEQDIKVIFRPELTLEPTPMPTNDDETSRSLTNNLESMFASDSAPEANSNSESVSALQQTIQDGVLADLEADLQRIQAPADPSPPSNEPQDKVADVTENRVPVSSRGAGNQADSLPPPATTLPASSASISPPKASARSVAKRLFAAKKVSSPSSSHRLLYLLAAASTVGLLAGAAYVYSVTQTPQFSPTPTAQFAPPNVIPPAETISTAAQHTIDPASAVEPTAPITSAQSDLAAAPLETTNVAPATAQPSPAPTVSAPLDNQIVDPPAPAAEEAMAEDTDLPDFNDVAQPALRAFTPTPAPPAKTSHDAAPLIRVTRSESPLQVNALVAQAYQAYLNADWQTAQERYQSVLRGDADNRDALLGLAAIAVQQANLPLARSYYARLLQLDAHDSVAIAGLQSVASGAGAPGNESELKSLIAKAPGAAYLHFSLGNVYIAQERWPDAERAFFEAYRLDKTRPDYAYNLAVSLDHLGQTSPALHYYETALTLASTTAAGFDVAQVTLRADELRRALGVSRP